MSAEWNTAVVDWRDRIISGKSLVPTLPLHRERAEKALRIFRRLRLVPLDQLQIVTDGADVEFARRLLQKSQSRVAFLVGAVFEFLGEVLEQRWPRDPQSAGDAMIRPAIGLEEPDVLALH